MRILICRREPSKCARILTARGRNFNRVFTQDIAARNGRANYLANIMKINVFIALKMNWTIAQRCRS
jgi:hypothetical protein